MEIDRKIELQNFKIHNIIIKITKTLGVHDFLSNNPII